jgi:hypothetical protein
MVRRYFSNQHILYKTSAFPIKVLQENYLAIPQELNKLRYNHIGDIDIADGIIYGGLESGADGNGILAAWNTSDLSIIRYAVTDMPGMPWVAIHPETKLIYSAIWNDCCQLQIYDSVTFKFVGTVTVPDGMKLPGEIQGAAFYQGNHVLDVSCHFSASLVSSAKP